MRTKILIMMLCAVQLVSAQLGDQLIEKRISKTKIEYQPEKMKVFGKCEGACFSNAVFNPAINSTNFKASHGSPSFSANGVWLWSYKRSSSIRGEGVFTGFKFVKGREYCIEVDVELSRSTNATIDPAATFNFDATNTVTANGVSSGGGNLPTITPRQSLISGNYASGGYPFNSTFKIRKTITANSNYSQLWIYPKNIGKPHPQLNMRLSNIVIKEVIPCPCEIKGAIKYKVGKNCQF